jgi:aromatic ring-opening dioxygenase LigB subunit
MKVNLEGLKLDSSNSLVGIFDERKGQSGTIDLDFGNSITLDRSQIVSIGEARVTTNTNGNYINVKSKDLTMNDSLIGGIVQRW